MRHEIFLIFQYLLFVLNIFLIVAVLSDSKYNFKPARVVLLLASCVFMLSSINEITWGTMIFSFAPILALINLKPNGEINKFIKGSGSGGRGANEYLQGIQKRDKTPIRQKT